MQNNEIQISNRDRLLKAWENSMEMVRDFQNFSQECEKDAKISAVFSEFAEQEGHHAAKFRELLLEQQEKK